MPLRTIALWAALLFPVPLLANSFTYTYTGDNFDVDVSGPYTTSDFVSVTVTFSAPLPDNFSGNVNTLADLLSWSFSDGFQTDNSTDPGASAFFLFVTNASGQITNWQVEDSFGAPYERLIESYYAADDSVSMDRGIDTAVGGYGEYDGSPSTPPDFNPPGSWSGPSSPSPVPEGPPFTYLLLGATVLGAAGLLRSRKRLKILTAMVASQLPGKEFRMRLRTLALLATLLLPLPLVADDITYNVALTIGTGTVTGFIETDGSPGILDYYDIVSWNLEMSSPDGSYDLYGCISSSCGFGPSNSEVAGANSEALIGTPTELEFSFSGSSDQLSFETSPYSGHDAVTFNQQVEGASQGAGEYFVFNGVDQYALLSGTQVIGTITPEPSSLVLLGTGLVGLAGAFRRKFKITKLRGVATS